MALKLYFMKCPERNVSLCILAFRPFSKYKKCIYALFTVFAKKRFQCWKIKALKHCENLLKVSNKIKQYAKNTIVRFH